GVAGGACGPGIAAPAPTASGRPAQGPQLSLDRGVRAMNNGDVFPTFHTTARVVRRLWRWTRLFLAGMTCTILLSYVVVNLSAGRALERQLTLVRERGEPLTLAEIAPPSVPD